MPSVFLCSDKLVTSQGAAKSTKVQPCLATPGPENQKFVLQYLVVSVLSCALIPLLQKNKYKVPYTVDVFVKESFLSGSIQLKLLFCDSVIAARFSYYPKEWDF